MTIMPRMLTTRADVDITVSSRGVGSMHQADRRPSDETSRKTSKTTKTPPWRAASGEDSIITTSTSTTTPFPRNASVAHFGLFDLAPAQPSSSSSDSYRRVKSANAGVVRRRQRHSASMQRSLSHSSSNSRTIHPSSSSQQTVPFLPIPPRKSDDTDDGSRPRINTAEESDLARMYDYATWNMYERIVSARRKRLAQIELEKQQQLEAEVKDKEEEEKFTTAESQRLKDTTEDKKTKKKNCQEDGSNTTAAAIRVVADATTAAPSSKREQHPQGQRGKSTFDATCTTVSSATESYRDTSSTSSWSGADSPLPIAPFQNFTTNDEEVMKSTMSRYDSFIFELDM